MVSASPLTRSSYHADAISRMRARSAAGRCRVMPTHAEDNARCPRRQEQMFDLVADVGRYPEFLPWCTRCPHHAGARATCSGPIWWSASRCSAKASPRRSTLDRPRGHRCRISRGPLQLSEQPLEVPRASRTAAAVVEFYVDFEFRSRLLQKAIGMLVPRSGAAHGGRIRGARPRNLRARCSGLRSGRASRQRGEAVMAKTRDASRCQATATGASSPGRARSSGWSISRAARSATCSRSSRASGEYLEPLGDPAQQRQHLSASSVSRSSRPAIGRS